MRDRIYQIIDSSDDESNLSKFYDIAIIVVIIVSLIPLAFKKSNALFRLIDRVAVAIFIVDYILRLITADKKLDRGAMSFVVYPFTPMAVIDLISILPAFMAVNKSLRLLRLLRMTRALKVLRVFKAVRYSKSLPIINNVIRNTGEPLLAVGVLAVVYILVSALIVFNVEPQSFKDFFEAVYWATISLTTLGYGDIYPVTSIGRVVTMVSSFFGIAIIALPAGIITAGFMNEIRKQETKEKE